LELKALVPWAGNWSATQKKKTAWSIAGFSNEMRWVCKHFCTNLCSMQEAQQTIYRFNHFYRVLSVELLQDDKFLRGLLISR